MDEQINIKIEAEQLNPSENLIQQELDWQGCFSENSEVTHSSSSNLNNEGLKLHIKQEKQTVPIKEEVVILSEINYYDPQDEPLDQNALNSFLWPSYLKKEIEESVDTQEKSGEKSQFNEILKSKNPKVLLKNSKHSHKKNLEQCQSEDYRKKLRPREESESVPYSLRKRSRQSNITFTDKSSDEKHSKISGKPKYEDSDLEDELVEVTEDYDEPRRKKRCNYAIRENENKKVFKCDHCDFKTNYKCSLRNHKLNCIKSQENILSDCFNIAIDENVDYHSLSLTEMINLICNQDKSLNHNTPDETTTEVLKCLECTFETGNQKIFNFHSQIHVEGKKCIECKFENKDADTFKHHLISHFKCDNIKEQKVRGNKKRHLNVEKFKCSDCSYKTKYKESFDAHCAKHKNIKLFKCDDCDFESNYKRHLVSHNLNRCPKKADLNSNENCVNQSKNSQYFSLSLSEIMLLIFNKIKSLDENASVPSPTEPLKCPECSFETENPKYFEFHSQIHSNIQKCPECGYECTDTETFKDHLITHLGQSRSDIESVPYSFRKKSEQFRKTLIDILSDEEQNEISVNDKNQDSDSDFEDEMSNEEMDTRDNNYLRRKKKFRCHDCSYTTWRSENFVAHCLDHTNEKLFKCEDCDFKTNYRHTIKKHNLKCIKNQKNSLSECFSVAIDENVNHHILSLSDIINLICSKYKLLDANTIGLATTEVLRCLECTFETGNPKILKLHSQIHVEVKKCTECNFESKDTMTFRDHIIGHFKHKNIKDQKMFKCCDCSYETKYKRTFDAHCAKHKNIKLFKCDYCDFESNYRKCLIRHSLYRCLRKTKLNSNKNCVVNESKNTEFSSLSLSEIIVLIYNKSKSLGEKASVESPTERLKCSECSFETENQKYFEFHSQIHSDIQKCPKCGYESTDTETFKDHLIKNHLDQPASESESAPSSFRKISKQFNKTLVEILSNEEQSKMPLNHKDKDSNFEDEISNKEVETRDNNYLWRKKKYRCHDCSYTTCKSEDLVAHCLDHANKKLFKCEHCDFKTNYTRSLRNHNLKCLKNHENSLSKCFSIAIDKNMDYHLLSLSEIISLICNKGKSLDHHTFDEITTEILKCLECTFETGNQKILNLHSQIHVEVKKCTECNFESADTETFKDHIIGHFKHKNIKDQKMIKCSDCSYETKYKESYDAHCAEHNKNIKLFKCDYCDFESNYRKGLRRHSLNHCSKKDKLNPDENCVVNQSKKTEFSSLSEIMLLIFNKRKLLEENASVKSTAEPLKCCECSFETENQKYFEFHSQIHSEVQKCPECSYECTDTETFKDHLIATHLGHSISDIESVPYSFKSNKTFKEYLSNEEHSEVKMKREYACDVCDFKTEFYPRFVSHLLIHNKDKSDCGYISTNLDNLKVYTLSDIISMICNDENEVNQDINLDSETKLHKCSQCIFECSDEEQFSLHLSSHSTEKKFICSQCSFEGTNQSDLDSHLQTHSTFKCSKCVCEFSDIVSWNLHRCELKSDKVFNCLRCNFETENKKHFTLHSQIHAKLRKCTECNFSHLHRNKFQQHLMTHLPKKLYSCTECGYKTNHVHKLKVHFLNHAGKKVFHCPKCDYKTNRKGNLRNHIENHLEFKSYRCSECNYSTSQSFSLKLHILDHSQKKLFLCSECDYGCNSKTRMSQHVLQHSREKLHKCSFCDFETNYIKNLKDHEARRHGGSFSYACSHCEFKCYKRSSLTAHSVIHSNTKLLKCPECSYECKKNLKLHMINMHSKTKMYKCSHCKYEGNHRSNFLTHIRTHSSERKYSCTECSFACNRKDNLKVHMTTHLKEKLSCAECSYKCSNKHQLKRHILSH